MTVRHDVDLLPLSSLDGLSTARSTPNKWHVTMAVSIGSLMGAIGSSSVNVAVPQMRAVFGASVEDIAWVITGFAIALVVVMPLTAFLGRQFGQKRLYLASLALFLITSALCGVAGSLWQLILLRFLQGLGAGAMQPTQQAILRQTFPPKEQAMAMAIFGMAVMVGPAIGPTLGGYILDNWTWSWIFYINLPVGVVALVMVQRIVQDDETLLAKNAALAEKERKHLDWQGIALLSVGLGALEYFLSEGGRNDWFESPMISGCFLVCCFGLVAFVIRELTAKAPAVQLGLFKNVAFSSGTLIGAVVMLILSANLFLVPVFVQDMLGFTALQAGVVLLPRSIAMLIAMPIAGRLYHLVDSRLAIGFGIVLAALGAWDMSHLTLASGASDLLWSMVLQGFGFSFAFIPIVTASLANIPRHRMADATGLNSLVRQLGSAVGVAIFVTMLSRNAVVAREALRAHVSAVDPFTQARLALGQASLVSRGIPAGSAHAGALAALQGTVVRQSLVMSFEKLFLLGGILFLLVIPLLIFLKVERVQRSTEVAN